MEGPADQLLVWFQLHGAWAVFVGTFLDTFLLPLPSQFVLIVAGMGLIDPDLGRTQALLPILVKIVIPGSLGLTLGAWFPYGVAYWGGKPLFEKCRGFLGFGWNDVEKMSRKMEGRCGPMILLLRATLLVPLTLISAGAGAVRMPFWSFSAWTLLGSFPRCLILGYIGYATRHLVIGSYLIRAQNAAAVVCVLGLIGLVVWMRRRKSARNDS